MTEIETQPQTQSRSRFGIALVIMLLGLVALFGWGLANNSQGRPQVGEPVPDIELYWFDGYKPADAPLTGHGDTHLVQLQGQWVVLNFWASWCLPCRTEMPELNAFHADNLDSVEVIGVAYTDVDSNSMAFLEEFNVEYGNAPDLGGWASDRYQIAGVPETYIIAPDGRLAAAFFGPVNREQIEAVIAAGPPPLPEE